ncbi:hypothetical protein HJC23_004743 [Cyclotella cryptica]|uniref:Uncharacterized protein n=1 Tax=Cyclotella cryptica TaxID=29204 RepID=A0ABD3NVR6_9STRA|eukprot:CCRYP_019457-RA/>CCRYP_019457-RA protein AED:0.13 eAED:0.13 QI:0/-1/0/1/-1/1/1/0/733
MKISILAITHLSLTAAQTPQRTRLQRRLKRDPDANKMRNILLGVRDIDGTPISIGPEGATARMSMSMLEEAAMTTIPPQYGIPDEIMQVFHDPEEAVITTVATDAPTTTSIPKTIVEILEPTASKASKQDGGDEMGKVVNNEISMSMSKGSKAKPRQPHHHHHETMSVSPKAIKISTADSESESNKNPVMSMPPMAKSSKQDMSMGKSFDSKSDKVAENSMPMGKAEKVKAVAKTTKDDSSSLSMGKAEKTSALSMESRSKATKESLSMPSIETKEEITDFSMEYGGKSIKATISMDSKAEKKTLSMPSVREGKAEKMALSMPSEMDAEDVTDSSMRFGGKAEKAFSMQSHAGAQKEEANEFWLEYDSKAEKSVVLSMDSKAAKSDVKAEKESITVPSAKTGKEAFNSLSVGYGKAEKTTFSTDSKADKSPVFSMDAKAAKGVTKAEKESLSLPIAKTMKEAVNSLSLGYGKAEKTSFSMETKADKSPVFSMDTKAAKGVSKAEKETLSMPAAKTTKEEVISLSMGYGGKAEKALSMDSHPRLFFVRKREQHRRLIASLSYSMSMEGEEVPDYTEMAVEYIDTAEDPVTIMTNIETSAAEEEKLTTSEEISESTGEVIDTIMSTSLTSKTSKTTLAEDPMAKAVKADHSLSLSPKSAKSIAPKAGKAKPQHIMSVNPKAEKVEHSLSMKGGGKAEKERDNSFSFSMKTKHALKHRLFDNRKEHSTRKRGVEVR